jgi:hypothetical protein
MSSRKTLWRPSDGGERTPLRSSSLSRAHIEDAELPDGQLLLS